jgi:DNA mismatch endonuclease (patch repair protein)
MIRLVVFVDGCFWHGCPEHCVAPKANAAFWSEKIAGNRERDCRKDAELRIRGWTVLHVWEHEDPESVADSINHLRSAFRGS